MELNEKNNTSMTELSRLSAHEVFINGFHLGDRFMAESLKPLAKKMMNSLHISILYHAVSHRRKAFFFTITAPYLRAVMASGKLYNNCCDYTLSTRNSEEFCYFKAVKIEMIYCKKSDDNI